MTRKCGGFSRIIVQVQDVSEAMTQRKIEAHESSGNVFADLKLPEADGLLLKSDIVIELHRLIKESGLTQIKAAKLLGITQPDLSHLLRGDFEDYSAERLMKMLIEIVMKPHRRSSVRGGSRSSLPRLKSRDPSGLLEFARAAQVGIYLCLPSGAERPVRLQHVGVEPYRYYALGFFAEWGPAAPDDRVAVTKHRAIQHLISQFRSIVGIDPGFMLRRIP
jgi:predicted XRE-type DNA-binding protein